MSSTGKARGWLVLAASAAVLGGLALVGLPEPAPVTPRPAPAENAGLAARLPAPETAVRELLARRQDAIRSGDEAAFAATVDPEAPAEFQQRQLQLFHNLQTVPLTTFDYRLDGAPLPHAPVPAADGVLASRVALRYALSGADSVPTERPLGYLFARRGASWYLTDDTGVVPDAWRGPWDFGPCEVRRTDRGLVVGHDAKAVDRVAAQLDSSVADVTEVWGSGWAQRVGVLVPESPEELRALVGPEFAVDGIAGVAVADLVDIRTKRVEGARVVLTPRTSVELPEVALGVVLRHEITHVAARAVTADGAPMWMLEGFPDYVGYRKTGLAPRDIAPELARVVSEVGPPLRLPTNSEFHQAGSRLDVTYQQSWSIVHYLAGRIGEDRLTDLYRRMATATTPEAAESALLETTGLTSPQLLQAWGEDLPRTLS
ncbi:hypothetical protein QFW96_20415 [Saccharopolyspora sp. TS4A08]|uniref:Peptidase MA-like domain-containing protein n=1 Tax=Saccharopolyspora ipomoeae TaxID=3042027 RepID=A0ABT6PSL9_9PSEU|nr:hypothetical protein [Saccharopolyspora sp. TS4A08]MDI2031007.1 hypothetical protein [Saccharopolyspora sp. TS4A08]